MYFDPLSAWLVSLVANGIVCFEEKNCGSSIAEYDKKNEKQINELLNRDIRGIKNKYGLDSPEKAYKQIQRQIKIAKDSFSSRYVYGPIYIDLDNQDYIIALLEACSNWYSGYSDDEARKKANWYRASAIEAKKRKVEYAKELEKNRINEEKEQKMSNIYLAIGLTIIVVFICFIFSR